MVVVVQRSGTRRCSRRTDNRFKGTRQPGGKHSGHLLGYPKTDSDYISLLFVYLSLSLSINLHRLAVRLSTMLFSRSVQVLLDGNAAWADSLEQAQPGFFLKSAEGQRPKVSFCPLFGYGLTPHRSSGSDAQTRASQNRSSPAHAPETSLSTATSPSNIRSLHPRPSPH